MQCYLPARPARCRKTSSAGSSRSGQGYYFCPTRSGAFAMGDGKANLLAPCSCHATRFNRDPSLVAKFLLAKGNGLAKTTVANSRRMLTRLIRFMTVHNIAWSGDFGCLSEFDLFGFLHEVHETAVSKGTAARPGTSAVWAAFSGLTVLVTHLGFKLPLKPLRSTVPSSQTRRGPDAILAGAAPLPPEALQLILRLHMRSGHPSCHACMGFRLGVFLLQLPAAD